MFFARGRRKPPKPSPGCSIDAHDAAEIKASIQALWKFAEDVTDENERLWNSLYSAWAEIDALKDRGRLRRTAEAIEKELDVK